VYRRAGDAHEEAIADPTVEKLHEWRKQAKYLRYQLEILTPIWPERMEELAREADRIGDLLGDDHDLAVLRQTLTANPERFGDEGDQEALLALIDRAPGRAGAARREPAHAGVTGSGGASSMARQRKRVRSPRPRVRSHG
jgi:CHAD domain-containing protein